MKDGSIIAGQQNVIAIYRETVGPLYAFVARRCGGERELAEDVTQETYLTAVAAWSAGCVPEEPLAWLQTVARNLLLNYYRKKRPEPVDSTALATYLDQSRTNGVKMSGVVYWGLARVRAEDAALLEAFYLEKQSGRAISERMGVSLRAVEGRLRRARLALKKQLQPFLEANGDI